MKLLHKIAMLKTCLLTLVKSNIHTNHCRIIFGINVDSLLTEVGKALNIKGVTIQPF